LTSTLGVSGDATWPLSWYVRDYPVNWGAGLRKVDTPVVIVDVDAAKAMSDQMKDKYDETRFGIRGWWEPRWSDLWAQDGLLKLLRYLFTRETWSPVGSSDAIMFALKEVAPGMNVGVVEVNPPPPPRSYPGAATALAPVAVWGRQGNGLGEFREPRGIAVAPGGAIFVVDSKNNRVQKLGPDGTPLLTWGSEGDKEGQFKDPCGIAASSDGFIYVADTWNHRVQKFDGNGRFIWQARPQAGFWGPRGIAVAPDGKHIYVTDTGNKRVASFDSEGVEQKTWGKEGSKPGELIEPVGITVDAQNNVIVADTGNRRLQYFSADGTFVREYPVSGWEEFYTEPYLAAAGGDLFASDSFNHRCARYNNGVLTYSWGGTGADPGDFNRPIGIAADGSGGVYVSDTMNNRVQKFVLPAANQ
jgi:sugar lactone lactonase YvrE